MFFSAVKVHPEREVFLFIKNSIALQKTLGVPCAEIYPLNLMQLVLPKGKVEANPFAVFSGRYGCLLQFSCYTI